eukprot:8426067-Lingulodinium_polyedra.AAC.1
MAETVVAVGGGRGAPSATCAARRMPPARHVLPTRLPNSADAGCTGREPAEGLRRHAAHRA